MMKIPGKLLEKLLWAVCLLYIYDSECSRMVLDKIICCCSNEYLETFKNAPPPDLNLVLISSIMLLAESSLGGVWNRIGRLKNTDLG
jgi:hypothetical protein